MAHPAEVMMIYVAPNDLRRPPEQILGRKGARVMRLFELIRQRDLTNMIAPHQPKPREITPQYAQDFLHAAHMSLRPS